MKHPSPPYSQFPIRNAGKIIEIDPPGSEVGTIGWRSPWVALGYFEASVGIVQIAEHYPIFRGGRGCVVPAPRAVYDALLARARRRPVSCPWVRAWMMG